jgi:hypothetical protein
MTPRRTIRGQWGLVCILLAGAITAPSAALAQSAALQGVLVLDNGNVLAGAIERVGDEYVINVTGATLQVPVDQVERFAPTLEEAYEQRRVTLADGTPDRHLELAAWCLHLKLFDQAARELLDARRIDAQIPGLDVLERRLRYRMDLEASRAQAASRASAKPLVQAPPDVVAAEPPLPSISVDAQAQFVRSIQPMLVRNCATSGCHQLGADHAMQLDRWALEGRGNVELVRRNLAEVLAEIDIENLETSQLLAKGRAVHGRAIAGGSRPLSAHQLDLLTGWMHHAFGRPPSEAKDPFAATPNVDQDATAFGDEAMEFDASVMPASFTPRDSFDPEIFNRRRAVHSAEEAIDERDKLDAENSAGLSADEIAEALSSPSQSEEQ